MNTPAKSLFFLKGRLYYLKDDRGQILQILRFNNDLQAYPNVNNYIDDYNNPIATRLLDSYFSGCNPSSYAEYVPYEPLASIEEAFKLDPWLKENKGLNDLLKEESLKKEEKEWLK